MKSNDSLQQVRPPFAMALTAVFASLLASTTSADHPGNPLILIPLLMLLPWVTWNHPPSLATSGAMLLTVSILAPYSSDGPSDLYLAYRTLWFFAGLLLGAALALIMGERIRSWHPHIRGWRYTLHPARIAAAATGIIVVLALFKPSPQSSQIEQTQAATNNDTVIFWLAAGLFITLLASISPTATMICLIAFISIHGVTTMHLFRTQAPSSFSFSSRPRSSAPCSFLGTSPRMRPRNPTPAPMPRPSRPPPPRLTKGGIVNFRSDA